jgi:hypothetical protein
MTIQDPITALVAFFEADTTVNTLTGGRIHGVESPVTEADNQPRKMLVFRSMGGIPQGYVDMSVPRIDFECYGETHFEAGRVWLAVQEALQDLARQIHSDTLLHLANQTAGPVQDRDLRTHWPMVWSSWHVWVGEESTA